MTAEGAIGHWPTAQPLEPSLARALQRLLLCNQVRELAGRLDPVMKGDLRRVERLLAWIVRKVYPARASGPATIRTLWKRVALDLWVVVLLSALLCRPGRVRKTLSTAVGAVLRHVVFRHTRGYACPPSKMNTAIRTTEDETPVIRGCLLLRSMKRYGSCIELLSERLTSGLPAEQTRRWLAFFFREVGDVEVAKLVEAGCSRNQDRSELCDPVELPSMSLAGSANGARPSRLRYGVVLCTLFDSDVFRSSLLSLLRSDFCGRVVVVEDGYQPEKTCEAFCRKCSVAYLKSPRWGGTAPAVNAGIERLDADADIILHPHNDLLWPPHWFQQFDHAWDMVYETGKICTLNLGYVQVPAATDAVLKELFVNGQFEDLSWILQSRKDVQPALERFKEVQNRDMGRLFGLGRESWVDQPALLHLTVGKGSVATSFARRTWVELGGFTSEMALGLELELAYYSYRKKQWNVCISNSPLIHLVSSDLGLINQQRENKSRFYQLAQWTADAFEQKYGMDWNHFFWSFFGETCVIHHDRIVEAINAMDFSAIDFVFDEFRERLRKKTLASCELGACPSRRTCRYVSAPATSLCDEGPEGASGTREHPREWVRAHQ